MSLKPIDNNLKELISRIGGERYHRFINVFMAWKSVVGELMAERSYPIRLDKNTLFVGVQNSAWMQELMLLKPDIIQKYKEKHNEELSDIVFLITSTRKRR
ncbi:MAG TPA: DUF721 domain-containing protein [Candidatus Cloacimonetes bacterium]|nr:DUF721 domain-containing protein [Candidatus Cloacimonadota bacterium]